MPSRYEPRTFMVEPDRFGVDLDARWNQPASEDDRYRLMASYQQHLACIEVLRLLDERKLTRAWLAEHSRGQATNLRRKLTGEFPALAEDYFAWAVALDTIMVLPAPSSLADAMPPFAARTPKRARHAG